MKPLPLPDQIDETAIPTITDLMEFFDAVEDTKEFGGDALKRNLEETNTKGWE